MNAYQRVRKSFADVLAAKSGDTDEFLTRVCLLHNMSYRLPREAVRDRMIGFRELLRLYKLAGTNPKITEKVGSGKNLLLVTQPNTYSAVLDYVNAAAKMHDGADPEIGTVVFKDLLSGAFSRSDLKKHLPFAIKQAILCIFDRSRANRALLIRELAEISVLLDLAEAQKGSRLYNFIPYEKDSNFISLVLRSNGYPSTLIPSAGPLKTHNHTMIGDEIILSTPYHYEELEILKSGIRARVFSRWIPERSQQYLDRYRTVLQTPKNVLGFYSHGSWLREKEAHADNGLRIPEAEQQLIEDLGQFLKKFPDYRMIIFAHPREKKAEVFAQTRAFYSQYFDLESGQVEFTGPEVKTAFSFEKVDIALAAFSTIQYERLFAGYKMLIGKYRIPDFPLKGSRLNAVCFANYDEMEAMILQSSEETQEDFFSKRHLSDYTLQHLLKQK